jgi:hypothetical protein
MVDRTVRPWISGRVLFDNRHIYGMPALGGAVHVVHCAGPGATVRMAHFRLGHLASRGRGSPKWVPLAGIDTPVRRSRYLSPRCLSAPPTHAAGASQATFAPVWC